MMSTLKKYQLIDNPKNETIGKLSQELENFIRNNKAKDQNPNEQINELETDDTDEERKEEFDIQIRQLMCQPRHMRL